MGYYKNVKLRNNRMAFKVHKGKNRSDTFSVIGMIRLRNEELLLEDTLNHLSKFVDGIVVFDDASTDHSVNIAKSHESVIEVIVNRKWRKNTREWEETANRIYLLRRAKRYKPKWFIYIDADERLEGDVREFIESASDDVEAIRVSLFDAYMTKDDCLPYKKGEQLYNFRTYFGIERRDIIMIWRNKRGVGFIGRDQREPKGFTQDVVTRFYCQHYGKSLSISHWDETCNYYIDNFPKYREKWQNRVGKAIHERSDFDTELLKWQDMKKHGGKKI